MIEVAIGTQDERILVVEDDPSFAGVISEVLRAHGYDCLTAHSDEEARKIISGSLPPRAMVVDVNLGCAADGFEIGRHARELHPQLPVVFMSGRVSDYSARAFGVPNSQFLQKPFTAEALLIAVMRALPPRTADE